MRGGPEARAHSRSGGGFPHPEFMGLENWDKIQPMTMHPAGHRSAASWHCSVVALGSMRMACPSSSRPKSLALRLTHAPQLMHRLDSTRGTGRDGTGRGGAGVVIGRCMEAMPSMKEISSREDAFMSLGSSSGREGVRHSGHDCRSVAFLKRGYGPEFKKDYTE